RSKYLWFSGGDTSTGSPPHVPLGIQPAATIRVTEGPLKADIAFALDGVPTVAIAGATSWLSVFSVLTQFGAKTVRLAFDADARENRSVAQALAGFCKLVGLRYDIQLEVWPLEKGKGIDDLLHAGGKPELLTGQAAQEYVSSLLAGTQALSSIENVKPP